MTRVVAFAVTIDESLLGRRVAVDRRGGRLVGRRCATLVGRGAHAKARARRGVEFDFESCIRRAACLGSRTARKMKRQWRRRPAAMVRVMVKTAPPMVAAAPMTAAVMAPTTAVAARHWRGRRRGEADGGDDGEADGGGDGAADGGSRSPAECWLLWLHRWCRCTCRPDAPARVGGTCCSAPCPHSLLVPIVVAHVGSGSSRIDT